MLSNLFKIYLTIILLLNLSGFKGSRFLYHINLSDTNWYDYFLFLPNDLFANHKHLSKTYQNSHRTQYYLEHYIILKLPNRVLHRKQSQNENVGTPYEKNQSNQKLNCKAKLQSWLVNYFFLIVYFYYFVAKIAARLIVSLQDLGWEFLVETHVMWIFFAFADHNTVGRFDPFPTLALLIKIVTVFFRIYWGCIKGGFNPAVEEMQCHSKIQKITTKYKLL